MVLLSPVEMSCESKMPDSWRDRMQESTSSRPVVSSSSISFCPSTSHQRQRLCTISESSKSFLIPLTMLSSTGFLYATSQIQPDTGHLFHLNTIDILNCIPQATDICSILRKYWMFSSLRWWWWCHSITTIVMDLLSFQELSGRSSVSQSFDSNFSSYYDPDFT